MGNFSVNHYSKISLESDGIKVSYIIDLAEIPTYQELQQGNVTADVADPAVTRFVASRGAGIRTWPQPADRRQAAAPAASVQPGDLSSRRRRPAYHEDGLCLPGGLSTRCGPLNRAALQYADNNFPGHAGWKEIVAVASPAANFISSSVPQTDRSAELTNYPTDLLNSPPQDLSAAIQFRLSDCARASASSSLHRCSLARKPGV